MEGTDCEVPEEPLEGVISPFADGCDLFWRDGCEDNAHLVVLLGGYLTECRVQVPHQHDIAQYSFTH